jgi:Holliday junction resolvasome RuvABC endonuclease subunit
MWVLGIDVALVRTGVAAIEDGRATWRGTITTEGEELGPRYVKLREALERLTRRMKRQASPSVVAVEQPELGIRPDHEAASVLKLFGAFSVSYVEAVRLWPKARVVGVEPAQWKGSLQKSLTARMMEAKYGVKCRTLDESDALGLADWAWDLALMMTRKGLTGAEAPKV